MEFRRNIRKPDKNLPRRIGVGADITVNVLRKSVFDTKNYYYYFTEVQKGKT